MNFVKIPTDLLECAMRELSPSAFKLFMMVWRKTAGWQKSRDRISYSQIRQATGIKSKHTIKKAIKEVGQLVDVLPGSGRSNMYEFDISGLQEKVQKMHLLDRKGAENAPFKPVKGAIFALKGAENAPTIDTITIDNKKGAKKKDIPSAGKKPKAPDVIPSFMVYVEVTGKYYLSKPQRKLIHEIVGTEKRNLEKWRRVVETWALCGYKPTNAKGMIDWYQNGIPDYIDRKNGNKPQKINVDNDGGMYL